MLARGTSGQKTQLGVNLRREFRLLRGLAAWRHALTVGTLAVTLVSCINRRRAMRVIGRGAIWHGVRRPG
ncbi:hypothetical protein CE195_08455 [Sodalis-like symbiont of Philaenus spumarius]|nr:hypothetical protein CE195_08455 [Sodalis-like symbiont of Philaenus spumarius]